MSQEARKFLDKAERALQAAETLRKAGDVENTAGRAYYAMLHAAQALLRQRGLRYRKHSGVHSAFGEHFIKTGLLDPKFHRWLLDAFDSRLRGDYDFDATFEEEAVATMVRQARELLDAARGFLEREVDPSEPKAPGQG
jgi:uncharacterized protein (UPF0332 family)